MIGGVRNLHRSSNFYTTVQNLGKQGWKHAETDLNKDKKKREMILLCYTLSPKDDLDSERCFLSRIQKTEEKIRFSGGNDD